MEYVSIIPPKVIFALFAFLAVLGFWVFNFIILYHLARFGIGTQPKKFAIIFLFGSIIIFSVAVLFSANLDLSSLGIKFQKLSEGIYNYIFK